MVRAAILALLMLAACGGGGGPASAPPPAPPDTSLPTADINLLFMGNSHTGFHDVPGMVAAMVRAGRPNRSVASREAPVWMTLGQRATDPESLRMLRDGRWSFVVLQAQEYSTSGQFSYPTDGAEALVRMTNERGATAIMFPEWPRRGINESQRIYDLHVSIAQKQAACVAPIPQSFEVAYIRTPDLALHETDGNHSSPSGAFLAALIIATTMTLAPPAELPYFPSIDVDAATQQRLRAVAAETIAANPPRLLCPGAPLLPN